MNRSQVVFFFAVLVVVIAIARYNSRTTTAPNQTGAPSVTPAAQLAPKIPANASPGTSVAATPAPTVVAQGTPNPSAAALRKAAAQGCPAVILISVFDSSW